jgi:pimeloyl-ACP methyl ester carboxylesterase
MTALPGLLLLHGVGDSGECWGPFVQRLHAYGDGRLADLDVSTPNAPAHGGNHAVPGQTLAMPDHVALAARHAMELAARSGGRIVVGGHSMGSAVALAVAASRPDLAVALWLEDPPFTTSMAENDALDPGTLVDVSEFREWFEECKTRDLDELVDEVRIGHPGWDQGEYEPWARAKRANDSDALHEPVEWIGNGWAQRARSLSVPTVVVMGEPELGSIVNPTAADEVSSLPGWSVHRFPVGHDVRRSVPEEVVPLLGELILSVAT